MANGISHLQHALSAVLITFGAGAQAGSFPDCLLDKLPGAANAPMALAVYRLCASENPQQYAAVEKGSGRGVFGFSSSEACIIKKSRDTSQPNAAFMIAAACRCLYDQPEFKGQKCSEKFMPLQ